MNEVCASTDKQMATCFFQMWKTAWNDRQSTTTTMTTATMIVSLLSQIVILSLNEFATLAAFTAFCHCSETCFSHYFDRPFSYYEHLYRTKQKINWNWAQLFDRVSVCVEFLFIDVIYLSQHEVTSKKSLHKIRNCRRAALNIYGVQCDLFISYFHLFSLPFSVWAGHIFVFLSDFVSIFGQFISLLFSFFHDIRSHLINLHFHNRQRASEREMRETTHKFIDKYFRRFIDAICCCCWYKNSFNTLNAL